MYKQEITEGDFMCGYVQKHVYWINAHGPADFGASTQEALSIGKLLQVILEVSCTHLFPSHFDITMHLESPHLGICSLRKISMLGPILDLAQILVSEKSNPLPLIESISITFYFLSKICNGIETPNA
jgi:hypothetical protein